VSALGSFFSRFAVKFVEVIGAGIATAVTGYLLAHFGGYLSGYWPLPAAVPAAIQASPTTSQVSNGPVAKTQASQTQASKTQTSNSQASNSQAPNSQAPNSEPAPSQLVRPARPVSAATKMPPSGSAAEAAAPTAAPARTTAKAAAATSRPRPAAEANVTGSSPRAAENDMESVEAKVRAALASVDAGRTAPAHQTDSPPPPVAMHPPALEAPHQEDVTPSTPGIGAELQPAARPATVNPVAATPAATNAAAATARAGDLAPPTGPQVPAEPAALPSVEIKSRPVAAVDPAAPPPAAKDGDKSLLSAITHIPDFLRGDSRAADGDAPRPPLPVGN